MAIFSIFGHFSAPKSHKRGQILPKMVLQDKIRCFKLLFSPFKFEPILTIFIVDFSYLGLRSTQKPPFHGRRGVRAKKSQEKSLKTVMIKAHKKIRMKKQRERSNAPPPLVKLGLTGNSYLQVLLYMNIDNVLACDQARRLGWMICRLSIALLYK